MLSLVSNVLGIKSCCKNLNSSKVNVPNVCPVSVIDSSDRFFILYSPTILTEGCTISESYWIAINLSLMKVVLLDRGIVTVTFLLTQFLA